MMFTTKLMNSSLVKALTSSIAQNNKQGAFNPVKCAAAVRCSHDLNGSKTESSLTTYKKETKVANNDKSYDKSPYKTPGPRRYGHITKYMTHGILPRHERPVRSLPPYAPSDNWAAKKAFFGQNDYIDILGDGTLHPSQLLTGPRWLIAFRGNERDRLIRQMEWEGGRLKLFYPSEYNRIEKRIRYLTKIYNFKRKSRSADGHMDQ